MDNKPATQSGGSDSSASIGPLRLTFCVWLTAAVLLGAGLRLFHLGDWSFWEDELYSIRDVLKPEKGAYSKRLGYVPVHIGLTVAGAELEGVASGQPDLWRTHGIDEWRARIGPCAVGILTIALLALAARRIVGDRAALLAALLLAMSPWHLYWSQAARFYSLQFLFYNLSLLWYFRATQHGSTKRLIAALAMAALAFLSQPPAIFIALVFGVDWLWALIRRKPVSIGWLGCGLIVLTFGGCLGLYKLDQRLFASGFDYWASLKGQSPKVIALGVIYRNHPVVVTAAAAAALALWRGRPRLMGYLVVAALAPGLALIALKWLMTNGFYIHVRYAFISHFACVLLAAAGLDALIEAVRKQGGPVMLGWVATLMMLTAMAMANFDYFVYGFGHHERWKDAFTYVNQQRDNHPAASVASDREKIAGYYLQSDDFVRIPADRARAKETVFGLTGPTWLVLRAVTPTGGDQYPWLTGRAELKASFAPRITQPYSAIHVYYLDPSQRLEKKEDEF